ncbi:NUDIX hydrolase [Actinorhabdospora filicis]|uniref:NUDIX hydrolase n=1 Tax=Actinorhabdospora filicis TaxID=1785913 RepID=A0A9W6SLZ4_9ACTN|nr:NUDIX hydrolase [Actinorhabdospora filicis]GLZ78256.1 NUDIX hydrolase [Actinorhabdospora filicis]
MLQDGDERMVWKNLGERPEFTTKWFEIRLADVELPDGRHLDHYLMRLPPVALCVPVNDRGEVLLLWRHRFITDTWGYELAAGIVDAGETIEEAAARECLEETGYRPGPLHHLITVEPGNGLTDAIHVVYWADGAEYVGHPEDDFESSRREWVPLERVPELCADGEIRSANAVAGLLLLHAQRLGR